MAKIDAQTLLDRQAKLQARVRALSDMLVDAVIQLRMAAQAADAYRSVLEDQMPGYRTKALDDADRMLEEIR